MKNLSPSFKTLGFRKTLRDLRHEYMQFIAVILLCFIGVFAFSGLYSISGSISYTQDSYARENGLADIWVHCSAGLTDEDLTVLANMPGVSGMQARASVSVECPDILGGTATLEIYNGAPKINRPYPVSGSLLGDNDRGACLIDQEFAERTGKDVGQTIAVRIDDKRTILRIKGIVLSPERPLRSSAGVKASRLDVNGYLIVNSPDYLGFPVNSVLIRLEEGADSGITAQDILSRMPYVSVTCQEHVKPVESLNSSAKIYAKIAWIVPALSYAIAVMVITSTLRRKVISQRTQIGIMKSLGMTELQIQCHYLAYALLPSAVGSAAGLAAGVTFLQKRLWDVVGANFLLPYRLTAPVSPVVIIMAVLPILFSVCVCALTLRKTNREWAAALLSPPVPPCGGRVFPECWPGVWCRLSFRFRLIFRSIGRNRARSFMQFFGVLFCNVLLIVSLGVQDSIVFFTDRHYGGTMRYEYQLKPDMEQAMSAEAYRGRLPAETVEGVMKLTVNMTYGNNSEEVLLNVLEDSQQLIDLGFVDGRKIALPLSGVIATKKLADRLGFGKGDTVKLNLEGERLPIYLQVEDIVTIYRSQGLYIGETAWSKCHRESFQPNLILLRGADADDLEYIALKEPFENLETIYDQHEDALFIMKPLSIMFLILEIISLGLCFAVCYNLGLVSFTERRREYATVKQLGYRSGEIRFQMLAETLLLSAIAILVSLVPAYWLTVLCVKLTESQNMLHATYIRPVSYIAASLVTLVFSVGIQWLLSIKAVRVPMAEAMNVRE